MKAKIQVEVTVFSKENFQDKYKKMLEEYFYSAPDKQKYWAFYDKERHFIGVYNIFQLIQQGNDYEDMIFWIKKNKPALSNAGNEKLLSLTETDFYERKNLEVEVFLDEEETHTVIKENYDRLSGILKKNGINCLTVSIPRIETLKADEEQNIFGVGGYKRLLYCCTPSFYAKEAKSYVDNYIEKISPFSYSELKHRFMAERNTDWREYLKSENYNARVFLIGPCIANSGCNLKSDNLAGMLKRKLETLGIYVQVICIEAYRYSSESMNQVFQYDLTDRDIVFIVEAEEFLDKQSVEHLDLTFLYQNYGGDKYLYYDDPIHATVYGLELIRDELLKKIIPWYEKKKETKHILIPKNTVGQYSGFHIENSAVKGRIKEYTESIKKDIGAAESGAIVMNANPFTYGHRYLIECALRHVERLIVFVVEEDESYIPYEARFLLVKKGTSDLPQVIVVPSGEFIISKSTFRGYFEKEVKKEMQINAAGDIEIFGRYIAKELHITKRFVGEEPNDYVTYQYNEQMKKFLKEYGVDLIEVPRKMKKAKDAVISASDVRRLLKANLFNEIKEIVPQDTFFYLKENQYFLEKRQYLKKMLKDEMKRRNMDDFPVIRNLEEVLRFISSGENVVIYGTGLDALSIMSELSEEVWKKVVLCDRKASYGEYPIYGKKVVAMHCLFEEYKDYKVVIATRKYALEIYQELIKHNKDPETMIWI